MSESIYFLGIGGNLMGSLAVLAKQLGYEVHGYDSPIYPPMSDQLASEGIEPFESFSPEHLEPTPDVVVIGNARQPRGSEAIEHVLNSKINYVSGAEWLGTRVLRDRHVLAVSGTHGKTTTASMLAWILQRDQLDPGFLIGGVPMDFEQSARLGSGSPFVVEADEYDTSYFDRQAKFLHYRPSTLIINNIEYDHADIYDDLEAIQYQFHLLIRAVPSTGLIIVPSKDAAVDQVIDRGCWSRLARFEANPERGRQSQLRSDADFWLATNVAEDGSSFDVVRRGRKLGSVNWSLLGEHNVENGLAALIAANEVGVKPKQAISHLSEFRGVKRRLEQFARIGDKLFYDDFAHHPSAIQTTLQGLRNHLYNEHITAVIEPRSHTMSLGTFRDELRSCCAAADQVIWYWGKQISWNMAELLKEPVVPTRVETSVDRVLDLIFEERDGKHHIVLMSNGPFENIYERIRNRVDQATVTASN